MSAQESNTPQPEAVQDTPQADPAPESAGTAEAQYSLSDLISGIPDEAPAEADTAKGDAAPAQPDTPPANEQEKPAQKQEAETKQEKPKETPKEDDPGDPFEVRYKNAQAWGTKLSQENAQLKQQLAAIQNQQPVQTPQAQAQAKEQEAPSGFDQEKFDELQETEGLAAALEYRDSVKEQQLLSQLEQREAKRRQQEQFEAEAEQLFSSHGVTEADFTEMQAYQKEELEMGYNPAPGALLVRQMAGDYNTAAKLIKFAVGELTRRKQGDSGQQPAQKAPAAPPADVPGGAGPQAPAGGYAPAGGTQQIMTMNDLVMGV